METILRVLDKNGKVLVEQKKTFNFKRYSMLCAARQKALDALYRPGAVRGQIITPPRSPDQDDLVDEFLFDGNGRSQFQM